MRKILIGLIFLIPFFSSAQAPGEDLWWEGQVYESVTIGDQIWLSRNLDVGHSINSLQLDNGLIEKFCYDWDTINCNIYGGLYYWNEAMDWDTTEQGLCPNGWHIPNNSDWFTLINNYPPANSNLYLTVPPFNGLLGGYGNYLGGSYQIGVYGVYHSSTYINNLYAYRVSLRSIDHTILQLTENNSSYYIRCIRDNIIDTILPDINILGKEPSCYNYNDGILDLKISGFINPTIIWNTGDIIEDLIDISAGIYSVTVTEGNVQLVDFYILENPDQIDVNINVINTIICKNGNNGKLNVTVTNGNIPYSYAWNTGATNIILDNLYSGVYSVTATDNIGCFNSDTLMLNDGISSLELLANIYDVTCNNGNDGYIDLIVTPIGNYNYSWGSEDIYNLTAGIFDVSVTSNDGCIYGSYIINEPSSIDIAYQVTNTSTSISNDGIINLNVTGGIAPYTYFWDDGTTNGNLINLNPGYYNVTVTDANNCSINANINVISEEILVIYIGTGLVSEYGYNDGYIYIALNSTLNNTFVLYPNNITQPTGYFSGLNSGTYSILAENQYGNTFYIDSIWIGYEIHTQDIIFNPAWNMFSTYILKENIDSLVTDSVIIVKNDQGNVYWPEWGFNNIDTLRIGSGYSAKYTNNDTLYLTGTLIPSNYPISIPEGWSILGYLLSNSTLLTDALYGIDPGIIMLKDDQGGVYWPQWGVNQIETLSPGKGYKIKMNYNDTLIYNTSLNIINTMETKEKIIDYEYNMTICFPTTAWATPIEYGSVIEAFDNNENLVGSAVYRNENLVFSIFGNVNEFTFNIKVDGKEANIKEWESGDSNYAVDKISVVGLLEIEGENFKCFPNPFRSTTEITYTLNKSSFITLAIYNLQGKRIKELYNGERDKGTYNVTLNKGNLKPGVYLCELKGDGQSRIIKLTIL